MQKSEQDLERFSGLSSINESNLVHSQIMLKQIENQIATAKQDIVDVAIEISEASKSVKLLEPKIKKAKDNLLKYENEVSVLNEDMLQSRQEKDSCQQLVQDARIKLIELESRRDQLKFKKA